MNTINSKSLSHGVSRKLGFIGATIRVALVVVAIVIMSEVVFRGLGI